MPGPDHTEGAAAEAEEEAVAAEVEAAAEDAADRADPGSAEATCAPPCLPCSTSHRCTATN